MHNPTTNDTGELRDKFKSIAYALAVNSYNSDQPRLVDHADDTVEQLLDLFTQYSQRREREAENKLLMNAANSVEYSWQEVDNWIFAFGSALRDVYIKRNLQSPKEKTE